MGHSASDRPAPLCWLWHHSGRDKPGRGHGWGRCVGIVPIWNRSIWNQISGSFYSVEIWSDECFTFLLYDTVYQITGVPYSFRAHANADCKLWFRGADLSGRKKAFFCKAGIGDDGIDGGQSMAFYAKQMVIGLQSVSACISSGFLFASVGLGEKEISLFVHDFLWVDVLLLWCCGLFGNSFSDRIYAVVPLEEKDSVVYNFSVRVDFWSDCAAGAYGNADQ